MDKISENKYFALLYKLTRSLIFISLSFSLILFLLYVMGNYQSFLDKTQILILKTLSVNSVISFVLCFCSMIELVILIIMRDFKVLNLLRLIPIALVLIINIFMLSYATVVLKLSQGL